MRIFAIIPPPPIHSPGRFASRAEAEAGCLNEEEDEEEEIGAADKDEQLCSVACLGRLSPGRALAAVDAQVKKKMTLKIEGCTFF